MKNFKKIKKTSFKKTPFEEWGRELKWTVYERVHDPRPSSISTLPPSLPPKPSGWLPRDNPKNEFPVPKTMIIPPSGNRYWTTVVELLPLEPNINHFRLMWKCSRCSSKIAIRHGVYDWKLYENWHEMLEKKIMFNNCKKCRDMCIGTVSVDSSVY